MVTPPEMVQIPEGVISLRDVRRDLTRTVELVSFAIGRTPVTCAQYGLARGEGVPGGRAGDSPVHTVAWLDAVSWCNAASRAAGLPASYAIEGTDVTWDVSADGFRLPTEAEWEWACRARTVGPTYGPLTEVAWTDDDNVAEPQPVGMKDPNDFGLFDMFGNVWEWCWDYVDPARYADYRTLRGGGWADKHWSVRASVRRGSTPAAALDDVGFRVAQGAVGDPGAQAAQGWSHDADMQRADVRGPVPFGWTPLRM